MSKRRRKSGESILVRVATVVVLLFGVVALLFYMSNSKTGQEKEVDPETGVHIREQEPKPEQPPTVEPEAVPEPKPEPTPVVQPEPEPVKPVEQKTEEKQEPVQEEKQDEKKEEQSVVVEEPEENQPETTSPEGETSGVERLSLNPSVSSSALNVNWSSTGRMVSNTGTYINTQVDWQIFTNEEGQKKLMLICSVNCYTLYIDSRNPGLTITVNGIGTDGSTIGQGSCSVSTPAITNEENVSSNYPLSVVVVDLPSDERYSGQYDVSVSWAYRGEYSGVSLPNITASARIS